MSEQSNDGTYQGTYTNSSPIIEERHVGLGVVGAILGALAGGVAWCVIGALGYVSGWIAILIIWLAMFGYRKFSGMKEVDKLGNVISIVIGLLMIIPSTYAALGWSYYSALNEGAHSHFTYLEVLVDLPTYLTRYDGWGSLGYNLFLGYIFAIIAAFYMISARKRGNKQAKAKK